MSISFPLRMPARNERLLVAAATATVCSVLTIVPVAARHTPPFDVTGHWTGTYKSPKGSGTLSADFSATADRQSFTGTFATMNERGGTPNTFTAQGTLSPNGKLVVNLSSTDANRAGTAVVSGVLNRATRTVHGTFHSRDAQSEHQDHGTFILSQQ